jgi:L-asparagine transporter-like permease
MSGIKSTLTRKAVKATAKHSAQGTASKLKRNPTRALTLLGLGGAIGVVAGWFAGRSAADVASVGSGS